MLFAIISLTIYLLWMAVYFYEWNKSIIPGFATTIDLKVSIIIPVRNERENIDRVIRSIGSQQYDFSDVELIVVDDHSTDDTLEIANKLKVGYKFLQVLSLDSGKGKKDAISMAVGVANGELIITIDADVRLSNNWLSSIVRYYMMSKPDMIILPVMFGNEINLFGKFQSLEFASLSGTTAASAFLGAPVMCNGANLAFTKSAFVRHHGYAGNEKFASGDDMFLLLKIKKEDPGKITYLLHHDVVAWTDPCKDLSSFINQRVRWTSKASGYNDFATVCLAFVVFGSNLSVLYCYISTLFFVLPSMFVVILLFAKWILDFFFLKSVLKFFERTKLLVYYPVLIFLYPIYVACIPILSLVYRPKWKGRNTR